MAETLGSLCDKLTIIKLKQWHSQDKNRLKSLSDQEQQLQREIHEFISAAISGHIPLISLTFAANKIYKKTGNTVREVNGTLGEVFSQLAMVNCKLWHEQEKVYEFQKVPAKQKNIVINQLARLNLERNQCIDKIDQSFRKSIESLPLSRKKVKRR